jgi:hypothetical protein
MSIYSTYERALMRRTIVAHGDIRHNLLERGFTLDALLVFTICCLQLGAEFLYVHVGGEGGEGIIGIRLWYVAGYM